MSRDAATASAGFQWDDGLRRLADRAGDRHAPWRERVIAACEEELRRRLGMAFTVRDLAGEYAGASAWFLAVATETAPAHPEAWEPSVVMDAAFGRFRRHAADFHGGGA
ncbi:MAG: hypothetical protein KDC33_09310 [Thermoleophilia bacterium]|nr:hypothetical protein [Thermoleophilia bacterium]